jgi:hypothetical protein
MDERGDECERVWMARLMFLRAISLILPIKINHKIDLFWL